MTSSTHTKQMITPTSTATLLLLTAVIKMVPVNIPNANMVQQVTTGVPPASLQARRTTTHYGPAF